MSDKSPWNYGGDYRPHMTDAEAVRQLEFGSCDGCGRSGHCPVCGARQGHGGEPDQEHDEQCPVPRILDCYRKPLR